MRSSDENTLGNSKRHANKDRPSKNQLFDIIKQDCTWRRRSGAETATGVRIFDILKRSRATAQVFRLKAEGYKTSRRARISHSRPSRFLRPLVQSPTQMPEVLCDHARFVPESLQSSAFSLSTWVTSFSPGMAGGVNPQPVTRMDPGLAAADTRGPAGRSRTSGPGGSTRSANPRETRSSGAWRSGGCRA